MGEEATITHDGKEITINVGMLNDIRKLGSGNYGSVMLVEVENHPEIKMAVKVRVARITCLSSAFFSFRRPTATRSHA